MPKTEFEQLRKIKGGLASCNTFVSTTKDRDASLNSAQDAMHNPDLVGVLFVMTVDPSKTPTPFAVINDVSSHQSATDEVLFSMHTVFRIHDIKPLDENNRLFQVDLTLTTDDDKSLRMLSAHIRQGIYSEARGWSRLSALFLHMGHFDGADQVNQIINAQIADRRKSVMEQPTVQNENVSVYNQRALIKYHQGEFNEAIQLFQQVLEINRKALPPNHPELAESYNNIGMVYNDMGDYPQALSSYEKVLEIRQHSLPPTHPDFAQTYIDIGSICQSMGDYSKALSFYEKAVDIQQQSLPPQHPDLGQTNKKLGSVFNDMDDYEKALSFYQKALEIEQQSLPPQHPYLGESYDSMGMVYSKMKEYSKAVESYERALDIAQNTLPPGHPILQQRQEKLEDAKKNL
jgi:tetratricopeptide (TPR) repeat protein